MLPLQRSTLRDRAYDALLAAIVSGRLEPGQRIRDQELAAQMGVSRTPIREALQRLQDEGLVESLSGALTRVTPLDPQEARHAFPVVAALHALATRLSATELQADDYDALGRANDDLAAAIRAGNVVAAVDADDRFHGRFVTLARNPELKFALDRVMPKVRRIEFARFGSLPGRNSPAQHDRIIEACRRRDAAQAAALVEENWLTLGDLISQSFEPPKHPGGL